LYFADRLKVALTMLVIAHHAAQPYGPTGGAWPVSNAQHSALLEPFFAVNAAFFMGLFFLVSGLFVPQSFDRKGAAGFMKTRLIRLGIPTAVYAIFLTGPIIYLALTHPGSICASLTVVPVKHFYSDDLSALTAFLSYLYDHAWVPLYSHLWFLLHLLLYGSIYVLWRTFRSPNPERPRGAGEHPTHGQILLYLLALAGVTWVVRIWYPIDRWVPLFFLISAEIAHLPQYLSLFIIGALAARHDWTHRTPARLGIFWLRIGLSAAGLFYLYRLMGMQFLPGIVAKGGLNWQSLVWCLWEAFICTGLCVGLPVWFRERFNGRPGGLARAMILAAYGAYIIHFLIVIALQLTLRTALMPPLTKFALVTMTGIAISFAISYALRYIPGVSKML
jgi:glucan biosynthesis protein C